jgi:hypothetical protein
VKSQSCSSFQNCYNFVSLPNNWRTLYDHMRTHIWVSKAIDYGQYDRGRPQQGMGFLSSPPRPTRPRILRSLLFVCL